METSIESNDPSGLLAAMHDSLSSGAVKWNQLSDTMRACSIPIDLILSSIELLTSERPSDDEMQGGKVLNTSAAHLLIELVQGRQISEIEACQPRASSLFEKLISSPASLSHARLAPKIASSFMLHIYMIKERGTLVTFVRKLFLSRATFAPALSLLETFPELDAELDRPSLLQLLVEAGQEDSAIKWAQRLGGDMQVLLTDTLIAQDRLKAANQAVKVFKLEATFPDVESQYHFKTVTKLIGKKLWSVAIQFAGQDQDLQTMVLRAMVEENEMAAANEFRKLLGLPESSLVIDPDAIRAEEERREATYLQLSSYLSPSQVLWVDGASLSSARDVLLNTSGPVGIDVEWKPTQIGGGGEAGSSRASILQLATEQQVLIFDLVSFSSTPSLTQELDRVLSIVMSDRQRLKLGFEISGDFKVLRASFPTMKCFAQVKGVLDLKHLWFKYLEVSGGGRVKRSAGLSTLCQSLLGKPLDKSMQCSDWQARPLTARQINYAALDSLCLILLFQKFQQVLPAGVMSMVVSSSSYDYSDSAAKGLRDENDDDDNDNDVPQWNQSERDDTAWGSVSMRESSSPPEVPEVIRATLERFGLSNSVVMKIGLPAAGSQVRTLISAEDAAVALGVEPDQIVKSMALWVRSADAAAKGLVCALRGSKRLDLNKVANILGVGRKSLSFASKGECLARFGYASGEYCST